MKLAFDPRDDAFRQEVRGFFAANIPEGMRAGARSGRRPMVAEWKALQTILYKQGWGAPSWPKEHGGTGWSPTQLYIFEQEAAAADVPPPYHQGLENIGPIIFTYGSQAQKERFLPRIVSGEDWWTQGYSEPGAGSDLASLRTRAVRDGDHYIVNGQKLWTSYAHVADYIFCLVRTDPNAKKQAGISLLLIDLKTPGIRIRPVKTLDERHHVNEVFFEDARVPADALLGEEGKGWRYGKVLLDRERGITATLNLRVARQLDYVRAQAKRVHKGGRALADDSAFRDKLAQIEIELIALEYLGLRIIADTVAGVDSGVRSSMAKVRWSELLQRTTELWVEVLGYDAALFSTDGGDTNVTLPAEMPGPMLSYLYGRVTTIYAGSNEIQRNIIARRSLGL